MIIDEFFSFSSFLKRSSYVQPLDKFPFAMLKRLISKIYEYCSSDTASERRVRLLTALAKSWTSTFTPYYIELGWKNSHLYPADPQGLELKNGCKTSTPAVDIKALVAAHQATPANLRSHIANNLQYVGNTTVLPKSHLPQRDRVNEIIIN